MKPGLLRISDLQYQARNGNVYAMYRLSRIYFDENSKYYHEAWGDHFLERSAEGGYHVKQYRIGKMLYYGIRYDQDALHMYGLIKSETFIDVLSKTIAKERLIIELKEVLETDSKSCYVINKEENSGTLGAEAIYEIDGSYYFVPISNVWEDLVSTVYISKGGNYEAPKIIIRSAIFIVTMSLLMSMVDSRVQSCKM